MLSREQAAKYLIVGWVKDWNIGTYLDVIYASKRPEQFKAVAEDFPWMPSDAHWYMANHGRGLAVRKLIADAYRLLGDRLWDAVDDAARLALYKEVIQLEARNIKASSRLGRGELHAQKKARRQYRVSVIESQAQAEWREANGRRAWNTVKA